MQLREKPLVYPRYPERQTPHHHSSDANFRLSVPTLCLPGSNPAVSVVELRANNTLMTHWRHLELVTGAPASVASRCHLHLCRRQFSCRRPAKTLASFCLLTSFPMIVPPSPPRPLLLSMCWLSPTGPIRVATTQTDGESLRQTRRKHTGLAWHRGKQRRIIATARGWIIQSTIIRLG